MGPFLYVRVVKIDLDFLKTLELVPKPQDVGLTQKFNNIRTT
ncbi:hypothetical protein [Leptospira interrogans]|nr:hypothetical protein [Leptospira interrogans]